MADISKRRVFLIVDVLTSPPHEYTALHQHGNRVGSAGAVSAMILAAIDYVTEGESLRVRIGHDIGNRVALSSHSNISEFV